MINFLIGCKLALVLNFVSLETIDTQIEAKHADSLIKVTGKVLNAHTQMPVKARIILEKLPYSDNIIVSDSENGTGDYLITLFNEVKYSIEVRAEGYTTYHEIITIDAKNEEDLVKDILLIPNMVGQILRMNKLFFKQSTAEISNGSYDELNSLFLLLKENPTMVVQLEGHTDYRGNPNLNMKLSQDRVEAVKKYLVNKGIKKNRIKLKAFGGTFPLTSENTEDAQKMNRRVEVRILKK